MGWRLKEKVMLEMGHDIQKGKKKEESTPYSVGEHSAQKALKPDQVKHVGINTELEYERSWRNNCFKSDSHLSSGNTY